MIADIKFACAHCGQHMLVEVAAAGAAAQCPGCGLAVTVPSGVAAGRDGEHARAGSPTALPGDGTDADRVRERLAAHATHARAEIKSFQAERIALKSELAQHRQRLAAVEAQLADAEAESTEAHATARQAGAASAVLRGDLEIVKERAAATATQLAVREAELAEMLTRLRAADSARAAAEAETAALQEESALLRTEVERSRAALAAAAESEARLARALEETAGVTARLTASEKRCKTATTRGKKLEKEVAALRRDLAETATGRELTQLREDLETSDAERARLAAETRQLAEDFRRADVERAALRETLKATHQRLEEAERRADAVSDERLQQDNEVLRGIIARQNGELEHRHAETLRLRRARLGLRLAYVLLAVALLALVIAAVQLAPKLNF